MSAGVLRAYAPLFHQLIGDAPARRAQARLIGVLGAATAVVFWFSRAVMHSPAVGGAFCCLALLILVMMSGGTFVASAARQNHPANACLVPHLRRRLITSCVVLSLVSGVALASVTSLFFGHFGLALAGASLLIPFLLLAQRFPLVGALPVSWWWFSKLLPEAWQDGLAALLSAFSEPTLSALGIALGVALLPLGLKLALPRGGDRHFSARERVEMWRTPGPEGAALRQRNRRRFWSAGYAGALRRDSARPGAPGRKMLHALGTGVYDGWLLLLIVGFSAVAVVALLTKAPEFRLFGWLPGLPLLQISILWSIPSYTFGVLSVAAVRAGEQALYRLAPAAPSARDFNRVFARALLLRFTRIWLVALAGLVCIDLAHTGSLVPRAYPLALASLTLPLACLLLPDYARLRGNRIVIGWAVALVATFALFVAMDHRHPDFPWLMPAGVIAAVTVLALWVQWWSMVKMLPPAFPVGRLAD